jgi:hypothetical protein
MRKRGGLEESRREGGMEGGRGCVRKHTDKSMKREKQKEEEEEEERGEWKATETGVVERVDAFWKVSRHLHAWIHRLCLCTANQPAPALGPPWHPLGVMVFMVSLRG